MATAAEALAQITSGMTVQDLRNLAATVSADVGDATLLLFSGGVGEIQGTGNGGHPRYGLIFILYKTKARPTRVLSH